MILFQNSVEYLFYLNIRTRSNVLPVHKISGKQLVKNYLPISLLPISGEIFEKLILNKIYNF